MWRLLLTALRTPQVAVAVVVAWAVIAGGGFASGFVVARNAAKAARVAEIEKTLAAERKLVAYYTDLLAQRDAAAQSLGERLAEASARYSAARRRTETAQDGTLAPVLVETLRGLRQ